MKNPTYRKVVNRGFTPIQYHTRYGQYTCWIEKVGRKLLHVRFTDGRLKKVPMTETRYMKAIDKRGNTSALEV